jgi:hypothetical protein
VEKSADSGRPLGDREYAQLVDWASARTGTSPAELRGKFSWQVYAELRDAESRPEPAPGEGHMPSAPKPVNQTHPEHSCVA